RQLPGSPGRSVSDLASAIERGEIKAMLIDGRIAGREATLNPELETALTKLEFLAVIDSYDSPLSRLAHIVLPKALSLEKDGSFTSFDRPVQRVRAAVPPMGESKAVNDAASLLSERMGYGLTMEHPAKT